MSGEDRSQWRHEPETYTITNSPGYALVEPGSGWLRQPPPRSATKLSRNVVRERRKVKAKMRKRSKK